MPYVVYSLTLLDWFWNGGFQNVPYVFSIFKMYNTGWDKRRRALDCFFIFMAEILGGYWQILDHSGKKIVLLSPLLLIDINCFIFNLSLNGVVRKWYTLTFLSCLGTKTCLCADSMHGFTNSSSMVNDFLFYIFQEKLDTVHEEEFVSSRSCFHLCFWPYISLTRVFENNPVACLEIAVLWFRGMQRSGDAWGNCLIVCRLTYSSLRNVRKTICKNSCWQNKFRTIKSMQQILVALQYEEASCYRI